MSSRSTGSAPAVGLLRTVVEAMGGAHRAGQVEMAERVSAALRTERHLLVQAGTGTGKSLAYLVPAVVHAVQADRPVVVSTATLALQAQIVGRDLPRLLEAAEPELDRPVEVALVKGRANYLCRHKLDGGFPEEDDQAQALFPDPAGQATGAGAGGPRREEPSSRLGREVTMLRQWAESTETGDRDDLPQGVSDRAWRQVSVSAVDCIGPRRCPMAAECFSEMARECAAEADIVVTNHAMLAIDAFEGLSVLPEHDAVIVDEAHELAERVTSAVTAHLSGQMVLAAAASVRKHTALEVEALQTAAASLEAAFHQVPSGLFARGLSPRQREAVELIRNTARTAFTDSKPSGETEADTGRVTARSRLQAILETADRMLAAAQTPDVVWLSRPGSFIPGTGYREADLSEPPTLCVAPTTVAGRMREGLFGDRTAVLTSATLTIGDSFDVVAGSLGLAGEEAPAWDGADVGSPFDYPSQGMLYVASHLPAPSLQTAESQREELAKLIEASGGATLALFSSRRAAEEAAEELRERLDLPILCQGEMTMSALVREFAEDEQTCLFGTMSLWQGVDVPGRSCRLVAIDRIPFPRPDDPLMSARSQEVARAGGNGFMQVSATHAAMRMAQGAGRLIRTSEDRGVLAVLDSRLATARYGNYLRRSMPDFWATTDGDVVRGALGRLAEPMVTATAAP